VTIFSPHFVGMDETRKSIDLSFTFSVVRPSCGSLRSVISSRDIILILLMRGSCTFLGRIISSLSNPSIRKRILTAFSMGSIWISLASFFVAIPMIVLARRIMGAACASCSRSVTPASPSKSSWRSMSFRISALRESIPPKGTCLVNSVSFDSFPTIVGYSFSINLVRSSSAITTGSIATPLTNFLTSSIARRLFGFTMASLRVLWEYEIGRTLWLATTCSGISKRIFGSNFNLEMKTKSSPL